MHCSTICLSLDNLKWAIYVKVKRQISLGVVSECELLNLSWSILALNRPEFKSHVILAIHLVLSINRKKWIYGVGIQVQ